MSIGTFTDKSREPTMEEIGQAVGAARGLWEALGGFLQACGTRVDLRFYGKSYGWALRHRKAGKALVSLYPQKDGFTAQVVLSSAISDEALRRSLAASTRKAIESAYPYPEGRWVYLPIRDEAELSDLRELLRLKMATSR